MTLTRMELRRNDIKERFLRISKPPTKVPPDSKFNMHDNNAIFQNFNAYGNETGQLNLMTAVLQRIKTARNLEFSSERSDRRIWDVNRKFWAS